MTGRLTVICQAPTAATRRAAFPADEAADPLWLARAGRLRRHLGRDAACWTAPACAARETAASLKVPTTVEPALRECDYGRWAGRPLADIAAQEPDAVAAWLSDPECRPHGGESIADLVERCATWLLGSERPDRMVAVVSASVVKSVVLAALGAPASAFFRIDVAPLSVTRMRRSGTGWAVASLNERVSPSVED